MIFHSISQPGCRTLVLHGRCEVRRRAQQLEHDVRRRTSTERGRALCMYSAQAAPRSSVSCAIVFFEQPVRRELERTEQPSTRASTIWVRFSVLKLIHYVDSE